MSIQKKKHFYILNLFDYIQILIECKKLDLVQEYFYINDSYITEESSDDIDLDGLIKDINNLANEVKENNKNILANQNQKYICLN